MEYIQSGQPQQSINTDGSSTASGATNPPQTTPRVPNPNQDSAPPAQPQVNNAPPPPVPEQQQQQQPAPAVADPPPLEGVENDWLSLIHNCVSFVVLFSIIFYYSSIERFLVILSIVIALMM